MKNNLLRLDEYRNNPEFYFCKGLRYANKKNIKEAYKNLQKALKLEPDNSEYKFNIACFLSEMHRQKEANRIFNDILVNFNPGAHDCYFGLGCNSFETGDINKAAEYFEKYLYFDSEGEFAEEVAEMIFYLKFYYDVAHGNRFVSRSDDSHRKARSYFCKSKYSSAARNLFKSINSNPFNIKSRNLLTLTLMKQKNFYRAQNINNTVLDIAPNNCWAACLNLYILLHFKKFSKIDKILGTIIYTDIKNREDFLCIVTTLIIFNKIDKLALLLEMNMTEYNDLFMYSILLLSYALTKNTEKFKDLYEILHAIEEPNTRFVKWLEHINENLIYQKDGLLAIDEYNKLFALNKEEVNLKFQPEIYQNLYTEIERPKSGECIIKSTALKTCIQEHREIMYSRHYQQEILRILAECTKHSRQSFIFSDYGVEAYSAALEYIYCRQYCIEMDKKELIQKYKISLSALNKALKKLNSQ